MIDALTMRERSLDVPQFIQTSIKDRADMGFFSVLVPGKWDDSVIEQLEYFGYTVFVYTKGEVDDFNSISINWEE